MSDMIKKIEFIEKNDLTKKEINIIDIHDNIIGKIAPVAVESCMNPGKFNIKPIRIFIKNDVLIFETDNDILEISVEKLESGMVRIQADEFVPKRVNAKIHCTECINCGRCSW